MDKRIKDLFFNEWQQSVKRCLTKLGIPYNKEAEITALVAVYYYWLITKEYVKHIIMDHGLDQNPRIKPFLDTFLQPMEPLEDALKAKCEKT